MNPTSNRPLAVQHLVDVQWALDKVGDATDLPVEAQFEHWVDAALADEARDTEMTVRIVEPAEMIELNSQYRHKNAVTNVLSFPADADLPLDIPLLGDLVICADVVRQEATEQGKAQLAHWAHMVVHGTLHLLGYDHIDDDEAELMEEKERQILQKLGYANPYEVDTHS